MTAPYLPERAYQYPGPPRTPAEWAQHELAAKDAEIAGLTTERDAFQQETHRLLVEAMDLRAEVKRLNADYLVADVRVAVQAAVAAERERIAAMIDAPNHHPSDWACDFECQLCVSRKIAATIRALATHVAPTTETG